MPTPPASEPTAAGPGARSRRRRALPYLVVGGLLAVTVLVALAALRYEQGTAADEERERAARAAFELQTALELRTRRLDGLHGLFQRAGEVTAEEFGRYVRSRRSVPARATSLSWVERVPAAERAAWEARNGRRIVEVGAAGARPAAVRADLFPVTYLAGAVPPAAAPGVDVGYDADRRDALRAARDALSGEQATRPRPPAAGRPGADTTFEIFKAVYRPGLPTSTVLERRAALAGFVVGAFRASDLAADLPPGVQVRDGARDLVGAWTPGDAGSATERVRVGERAWTVGVRGDAPELLLPATALFGGLVLTGLAGAIFVVLGRRERYAIALLARRLDERRRAEAALGVSEAERRRREEDTRRQRDYANSLIASLQDGLVAHAPDGTITQVNDRFCEMVGLPRERLVGARPPLPYWPAGEAGRRLAGALARPQETAGRDLDAYLRRGDGERFPVIVTGAPLRDAGGAISGSVWTVKDMTARRRAEEARRASEEKFRLLAEYSTDLVGRHALDGTILYCSPSARALLGYPPELLVGRALYDFCHPEDIERLRLVHADALAHTGGSIASYRVQRRDGTWIWLETTTRMVRDERTGELLEMHTASRDVTARRQAEEALFEARERFESAFENAPVGIALFDAAPEGTGRLLHVNQAMGAITGRDPAALRGRRLAELLAEDGAGDPLTPLASGEAAQISAERALARADGSVAWVRVDASLVRDAGGRPLYAVGQFQDVSERRALDQMKADFAAVASHELRTPLTSVLGYLDLVLEGGAGPVDPEQRRYLSVAQMSAERLLRLADDLLLVARSDAGRLRVEVEALDLGAVVAASVHAARPVAEERGIALGLTVGRLPVVLGDATRLGQVVDNLLANALKFTEEGGRVDVDVGAWGEGAVIEVADTGVGIPPDEQGRLFERFFRTRSAARGAVAGTGLGLAISKMIVEAHGGTIAVASAVGRGTTFRVELPRAARRRAAPPSPPPRDAEVPAGRPDPPAGAEADG